MSDELTKALGEFHDAVHSALDLVDGYRNAALERGYSPTAAEHMALVFHGELIAQTFRNAQAQQ